MNKHPRPTTFSDETSIGAETAVIVPPSSEQSDPSPSVERLDVDREDDQQELEAEMAHLRGMLERGEEKQAHQFALSLAERWPGSARVQRMARILAPPTTRLRPDIPNRSFARENKWLKEHAHEYPGCWLAVLGDRLVASDPDYRVVRAAMQRDPALQKAILYFAGRDSE